MTAYITNPLQGTPPALIPGKIGYSFGSFNDHAPNSRLLVTSVAITSNVATLGVTLVEGFAPVVGSLISVQGTQTATSGGAPNFNVVNVALTAVSIDAVLGTGTVSFALTSTNITTTADAGQAVVPTPTVLETLPGTAAPGLQFGIPSMSGGNKQHGLSWFTEFSGSPSTVAMNLQIADEDKEAEYTTIDTSTLATGETRFVANVTANFVRIKAASTGGTTPKVAAGILLS